ncbi:MAG: PH domain-containing protein [Gammaproteobacteria bacterium]|nr:PH domain-containing protein [Gammaproteobacteria bacterium]NVK87176.1 PH domain-containing protein [Gammaproteobacteria bacterium]
MNDNPQTISELYKQDQSLAAAALPYFKVRAAIRFLIYLLIVLVGLIAVLVAKQYWPDWPLVLAFIGLASLAGYFSIFYYPQRFFATAFWRFDEQGLFISRGVIFRRQFAVPRSRVQHIDVAEGPLQRHFKIAQLIVHTAGTINASVYLLGLEPSVAAQLRDDLMEQDSSDAV